MATLPPDLDRLGQQLTGAAAGTLAARRRRAERRRRVLLAAVAGVLAFAVLTPGPLGSGMRDLGGAHIARTNYEPVGCDGPRGADLNLPACEEAMILYRPYAVR